ncbi:hypothetical protein FRB95_014059 [Tulasnella sp. JGI-2019a]|nr:hypothetical protein FRB93_011117 [Tulasnella sp. JGI-2019a]KAG9022868.1 hypothetical protein FRB95_014059 [Tulasnella sp. JGI-2019a]
MVTFHDFSVNIRVNGKNLPCFQPEYDEESRTATCWIPSEAGQEYSISLTQEADICPGAGIAFQGFFDGERKAKFGTAWNSRTGQHQEQTGACTSLAKERPFMFGNIALTDDDSKVTSQTISPDLGSIKLTIKRVRRGEASLAPSYVPDPSIKVLHERSKKVGGHITQLGPVRPTLITRQYRSVPYQPSDILPWVTFIFMYRPAAVLKASGIMPHEDPPEIWSSSSKPAEREELNEEEERANKGEILRLEEERIALEQKLSALNARAQALSSHENASVVKQEHAVKQEQSSSRRFFKSREVIDLTLEDD